VGPRREPRPARRRTRADHARALAFHHLLGQGVGLLECARCLDVALNTVKRYARTPLQDPAVPALQLFWNIKELGYTGSLNLLYRYITQGRAEGEKPVTTPQRFAGLLLTRPENLRDKDTALLRVLTEACPEITELARLSGEFARQLTPAKGNNAKLTDWITTGRAADLPHLHSFANGLELNRAAVDARLTLPHHNGRTEAPIHEPNGL
jgi:hypothetical protein